MSPAPAPSDALERRLGYRFVRRQLLETALSHASFVNEATDRRQTYERLEFIGDAVLGLLCAELLYQGLPDASEGELSRRRARVVRRETLAVLATELSLEGCVRVGAGHRKGDNAIGSSILADVFEALIGAVYLDGSLDAARQAFAPRLQRAIEQTQMPQDFKTRLQELAHRKALGVPIYRVEEMQGPAHERHFTCSVWLDDKVFGRGRGTSKKTAEQICAKQALMALGALTE